MTHELCAALPVREPCKKTGVRCSAGHTGEKKMFRLMTGIGFPVAIAPMSIHSGTAHIMSRGPPIGIQHRQVPHG